MIVNVQFVFMEQRLEDSGNDQLLRPERKWQVDQKQQIVSDYPSDFMFYFRKNDKIILEGIIRIHFIRIIL